MVEEIIQNALSQPKDAITYYLGRELAKAFPDSALIETRDRYFQPFEFADEGKCTITERSGFYSELDAGWDSDRASSDREHRNSWSEVEWNGHTLQLITLTTLPVHCEKISRYLLADSEQVAEDFFETVCAWYDEVRGEVLVFSDGHWHKSKRLYDQIAKASLDDIVLAEGLRDHIVRDFEQFFASRSEYEKHRIPWKRGVLFLGPPGNGKTFMVKALAKQLGLPCLYARSFSAEYQSDHSCMTAAFNRARELAPCLFILEDLDSLLDDQNRAFFLNELDGFYDNTGILTLATTNHPERLDPAILQRPSRFDRKYTFNLPGLEERVRYLSRGNENLQSELRVGEREIHALADATDNFSFAYLKELFLGSMMQWMSSGGARPMFEVAMEQVHSLREQMSSVAQVEIAPEEEGDGELAIYGRRWRRRLPRM